MAPTAASPAAHSAAGRADVSRLGGGASATRNTGGSIIAEPSSSSGITAQNTARQSRWWVSHAATVGPTNDGTTQALEIHENIAGRRRTSKACAITTYIATADDAGAQALQQPGRDELHHRGSRRRDDQADTEDREPARHRPRGTDPVAQPAGGDGREQLADQEQREGPGVEVEAVELSCRGGHRGGHRDRLEGDGHHGHAEPDRQRSLTRRCCRVGGRAADRGAVHAA